MEVTGRNAIKGGFFGLFFKIGSYYNLFADETALLGKETQLRQQE